MRRRVHKTGLVGPPKERMGVGTDEGENESGWEERKVERRRMRKGLTRAEDAWRRRKAALVRRRAEDGDGQRCSVRRAAR